MLDTLSGRLSGGLRLFGISKASLLRLKDWRKIQQGDARQKEGGARRVSVNQFH